MRSCWPGVTMSSSSRLGRRIVRPGDGVATTNASYLIDMPANRRGNGGLDDLLEKARQEGRDEGYRAATAEIAAAEAAGRSVQLRRVADAIVAGATEVGRTRVEAMELAASEAAELAYQLAEAFLQRELTVGQPAIEALTRALHLVPEDKDVTVRLHPGDAVEPDELQQLLPDVAVRVVADARVEPGGCVVVAGPCRIDTQISSAMERARQVLSELYPAASEAVA